VATLSGFGQSGESFCGLFGVTDPLPEDRLVDLYGDHGGFVDAWNQATDAAVDAGCLLAEDADLIRQAADRSHVLTGAGG
jgi:hypothetical protein